MSSLAESYTIASDVKSQPDEQLLNRLVDGLLRDIMAHNSAMNALDAAVQEHNSLTADQMLDIISTHGIVVDERLRANTQVLDGVLNRLWYENAWKHRLRLVQGFIQSGCHVANQALNRLFTIEGYKQLHGSLTQYHYKDKSFLDSETELGLLPTGKPPVMMTALAEHYIRIPRYLDSASFIADFLEYQETDFSAVVELGCGTGRNLFDLYLKGVPPHLKFFGADWSPSAIQMVDAVAQQMPDMNLTTFQCDFFDMKPEPFACAEPILIYTYHAIEQVHKLPADFFDRLARACPQATGIHFEPFGYQIPGRQGTVSEKHKAFCQRKKWNANLLEVAIEAQKRGVIDITHVYKNIGGGDPGNPTSVLMWKVK